MPGAMPSTPNRSETDMADCREEHRLALHSLAAANAHMGVSLLPDRMAIARKSRKSANRPKLRLPSLYSGRLGRKIKSPQKR